jgi:site-specific recombinase XerD
MPKQHPRTRRPSRDDIGSYVVWIDSWDLALRAVRRSPRTRTGYHDDMVFFAGWLRRNRPKYRDWSDVDKLSLREFFAWLQEGGRPCPHVLVDGVEPAAECSGFAVGHVRHVAVSVDRFYAWWSKEEDQPNPVDGVELPQQQGLGKSMIPVIEAPDLGKLIRDAEADRSFHGRRDAALLRLFTCTGVRLAELAGLRLGDVNLQRREAVVTGKGSKERKVRFDDRAALALDRYLRARARRPEAKQGDEAPLWLGHVRARTSAGMTASGIYQAIRRRGQRVGVKVHPHQFRHTFSHRWLDQGGAEGDLMELNGWDSPQMLRHYGASARAARARRAYDRVNVMGDI